MISITRIVCSIFMTLSFNIHAALVDSGDFFSDESSGFDWLDLSFTYNKSIFDVSSLTSTGGALDGWRYATLSEIEELFTNLGGSAPYNDPHHGIQRDVTVTGQLVDLWGFSGNRFSALILDEASANPGEMWVAGLRGYYLGASYENYTSIQESWIDSTYASAGLHDRNTNIASALIRETVSPVPVPAATWLFGSGLLGLVGVARRKKYND